MKILLWAPFGAGEHYWGPGTSAYRMYGAKQLDYVKIDIAHGFKDQQDPNNVFSNSYFISDLTNRSILSTIIFLVKSWFVIRSIHRNYDVVHCLGGFEFSFQPALWFQKRGVPAFCKITDEKGGIVGHSSLSRVLGLAKRRKRNLNKISGFIAISSEIESILKSEGVHTSKIFKIPNGVDTIKFQPLKTNDQKNILRDKYKIDKDSLVILFVGGISSRKRPFELIKTLETLLLTNENKIRLVLLGPDRSGKENLLKKINTYILKNNLEKHITHFDHTSTPNEFYQLADIFVLPSTSEGMSNAVLEAMASGLPTVVTSASGMKDMILENETGYIVNLERFPEKISYYINKNSILIQHSNKARDYAVEMFSASEVLRKHLVLFKMRV